MMVYIPEDRTKHTPQWWNSERYDYCDMITGKDNTGLFNKLIKKFTDLFA